MMSRLGSLTTKDEQARYAALTFRMCEHDHWDVSMCDCPQDCEDIQEYAKRGDREMNKEPVKWNIVSPLPEPPPPLELASTSPMLGKKCVHVDADGLVVIRQSLDGSTTCWTNDLCGLITSLQSILALAEEHFGEEWGK